MITELFCRFGHFCWVKSIILYFKYTTKKPLTELIAVSRLFDNIEVLLKRLTVYFKI